MRLFPYVIALCAAMELGPAGGTRPPGAADASTVRVEDPRFAHPLQLAEQEARDARGEPAKAAARAWAAALRSAAARAQPQDSTTVAAGSRGGAWVTRAGSRLEPKTAGLLREGDALGTSAEGWLDVRFEDGSRLTLQPGASLTLMQVPRPGSPDILLSLEQGRIYWEGARPARGSATLTHGGVRVNGAGAALEASAGPQGLDVRPLKGSFSVEGEASSRLTPWHRVY